MQRDNSRGFTVSRSRDDIVFRNLAYWVKLRLLLLQGSRGLWEGDVGVKATETHMQTSLRPD